MLEAGSDAADVDEAFALAGGQEKARDDPGRRRLLVADHGKALALDAFDLEPVAVAARPICWRAALAEQEPDMPRIWRRCCGAARATGPGMPRATRHAGCQCKARIADEKRISVVRLKAAD